MAGKTKRLKGLHTMGDDGKWIPGKVSELIHDFARPLLDATGKSRNIDDLRTVFRLATLCWNLPVFEKAGGAEHAELQHQFDDALGMFPRPVASIFEQLIDDRKTTFGEIPFWIIAEVRGTTLDDASVYAEARQAPPEPPR